MTLHSFSIELTSQAISGGHRAARFAYEYNGDIQSPDQSQKHLGWVRAYVVDDRRAAEAGYFLSEVMDDHSQGLANCMDQIITPGDNSISAYLREALMAGDGETNLLIIDCMEINNSQV